MLDKLQKRVCRTVGPTLASFLEPLNHRKDVTSLSLFYTYYFGKCLPELAEVVPRPFFRGKSTCSSGRLHDFSFTFPRCYKDIQVSGFFLPSPLMFSFPTATEHKGTASSAFTLSEAATRGIL